MTAIVGVEPGYAGRCSGESPDHSACEFNAGLRDGRAGRVCDCPCGAEGSNEEQADAGQHINTGTMQSRLWCAHSTRGLETGQPPETVRGGHDRQLAWLPVSICPRGEPKKSSRRSANFFGLS
jgi:hypothetical protein